MPNKRRHAQAFPLTATLIGLAVAVCLTVFAIKALTVKYQVIQGGDKLKRLERELVDLTIQNEGYQTQKDQLTSAPALQRAMANGLIDLDKLEDKYVVVVGRPPKPDLAKPDLAKPDPAKLTAAREDRR